jgi:tetratricopeptide (TPR) repeat protein
MRKTLYAWVVITTFLFFFASCSTPYLIYSQNMFVGKALFKQKEYEEAKKYFEEASKNQRDPISLTYLAIVCYKMDDLNSAESYIKEAEKIDKNTFNYMRIIGYKALILLKMDRKEGLPALEDYIELYGHLYPLTTIIDVKKMYKKKEIDLIRLEKLMDEQISWYEDEIEQFATTHTGFYDKNPGTH